MPAEQSLRRVAVMGKPGSGKSMFAVQLAEALGAPAFHLDTIYWKTGEPAATDVFRAGERELLAVDRWVLDGNYSGAGALEERLARADALVFMDVSRRTALRRILRRHLHTRGAVSAHGNPDGLSREFIGFVWHWERNHRGFIEALQDQLGEKPMFVLRNRREAERLLATVRHCRSDATTAL